METVLSLKEYQQGAYRTESAELNEVGRLIRKVLPLYNDTFLKEYWPYVACENKKLIPVAEEKYSASTNAMILVMLSKIIQKNENLVCKEQKEQIEKNISSALDTYFSNVLKDKDKFVCSSTSYGENDPLNLYWAHLLCDKYKIDQQENNTVKNSIKEKVEKVKVNSHLKELLEFKDKEGGKKDFIQQAHPFIVLYAYRGAKLSGISGATTDCFFNFFELRLHQNLSFHLIPDSRFDPAELVFCLEGMLLCKPSSVSDEILHRVFEVLGEAQNITPCWRPVNPVYATPQGQIFLPLSIEVGMSLLNIFYEIDRESKPQSYFAKYLPMLQRYFKWLKAQEKTIRFRKTEEQECDVSGWESEHVGNEGVIHIWQTALILDYLASYGELLRKHIARQYLMSSGLAVVHNENYTKGNGCVFFDSNPFPIPELINNSEFKYNVPKFVFEKFILGRKRKARSFNCLNDAECCSKNACSLKSSCICLKKTDAIDEEVFSLLLYGPPGTGKSFFSKEVARCLGWKHITVTPSDFLADGSAEIEARAKGIFSCLMEQENAVILFDEIDQFVLDRDSERYRSQTDVFKLLTPGMLPKFQDLRDSKKCIFIVATNYAERIDPAITRLGRIDIKIPLMPPNWEKRKEMLVEGLHGFDSDLVDLLVDKTSLYTWNELKKLIDQLKEQTSKIQSSGDKVLALEETMGNCIVANLTFNKVIQRLECYWPDEPNNSKLKSFDPEHHAMQTVIEELALMCLISAGDKVHMGAVVRKNFAKEALQTAVESKVNELIEKYKYYA